MGFPVIKLFSIIRHAIKTFNCEFSFFFCLAHRAIRCMRYWDFQKQQQLMISRRLIENLHLSTIQIKTLTTLMLPIRWTIPYHNIHIDRIYLLIRNSPIYLLNGSSRRSIEHTRYWAIKPNAISMIIMAHWVSTLQSSSVRRMSMHTLWSHRQRWR